MTETILVVNAGSSSLVRPPPIGGSAGLKRASAAKRLKNSILRPEHDGGPQDDRRGKFRQNRHFARSLRAGVFGTRFAVGADRRDMNETGGRP